MFNNSYIKMGRYNRIVHILYNSPMINELQDEVEYLAKLRKVTEINLTNSCQHYVMIGDNFRRSFRNTIRQSVNLNFDVAVIWFEGSWPMGREFEEDLLHSVDNEWQQFDWLVAGHILDKPDNNDAPHFHNQCVVINLKNWDKIDDSFGMYWNQNEMPNYFRSQEHIHDDYTPMFLMPRPDSDWIDIVPSTNKLDVLIPVALRNNMYVLNLNHDIRGGKHCCYPEDDVQHTKTWLLDQNWHKQDIDTVSQYSNKLDEDKQEIYGFKCMNTHVMYITNTESVPGTEDYNCTVMTAPCSGLHQFKHMTNARNTLKKVVWTDFSEAGIWWTKKVLAEWDGTDFDSFYKTHAAEIEETWVAYHANNYSVELVREFEEHFSDQVEWLEYWNWIKSLEHVFMQVDMIRDWKDVVETIGQDEIVFMQVSNIWQYEINYLNNGYFAPQSAFIGMVKELLDKNRELYITGDSPGGVYYNYQNMKELVSII